MKNYLTNLLILEQSIAFFFFLLQRYEISRYESEKTIFFLHNTLCNRFPQAKIIKYSRFLFADQ